MFSWASWCCWYSKTRNFCITSSQDLIYSKKNEGNLKKLPKSAKNWPHMSNFPQLFGQNLTILWSRHVVLMSMKLTMPKKSGFCNVFWPLGHLLSQKHTWGLSGHLLLNEKKKWQKSRAATIGSPGSPFGPPGFWLLCIESRNLMSREH